MTSSLKSTLPKDSSHPLGLIAGRGELPKALAQAAFEQGRPLYIIGFEGQTDDDLMRDTAHIWLKMGEVGKALTYFKTNGVQDIVMAGHMTRPSLTQLKPDWEGAKWLAKLGTKALGDDNLLKSIIQMVEAEGLRVVGADDILSSLLAPEGILTRAHPDEQASLDMQRGHEVLKHLSEADVGQAVVIQQGLVLGVEAIEGTDALIERCGELQRQGVKGVLVKQSKWQQERRVDLPTVGPKTIENLIKAGLRGLAIEAGHTLVLEKQKMIDMADAGGLFITCIQGARCQQDDRSST